MSGDAKSGDVFALQSINDLKEIFIDLICRYSSSWWGNVIGLKLLRILFTFL